MKSLTITIIRGLLANRIGWFADQIGKGPEQTPAMAADMHAVTAALVDFLAGADQPAQIPANASSPRAEMLLSYLETKADKLGELDNLMTQSAGNGSPAHKVIKRVLAFVSDPSATTL